MRLLLLLVIAGWLCLSPALASAQRAVFLLRHAEKVDQSRDAALTPAGHARARHLAQVLRDAGITAVYTSEFQRTRDTAAPLCQALGLQPRVVPAAEGASLIARLRRGHASDTILIVGHGDTLPDLMRALGVPRPPTIAAGDYDNLFVVIPQDAVGRVAKKTEAKPEAKNEGKNPEDRRPEATLLRLHLPLTPPG